MQRLRLLILEYHCALGLLLYQTMCTPGVQMEADIDGMTTIIEAAYEVHLYFVKTMVRHTSDITIAYIKMLLSMQHSPGSIGGWRNPITGNKLH